MISLFYIPFSYSTSVGTGIGLDITPEEFGPQIWLCDSRLVTDDALQGGRETDVGEDLDERINNYAFEGEQIAWTVLVMDKNKIEEIEDVVATIGETQGTGNDIEVECEEAFFIEQSLYECNARLGEELITEFDEDTMDFYDCILTVETPESMYGEYFVSIEAIGVDGEDIIDENEYWFLNPVIALSVDGDLTFEDVRPGTVAYSSTLLVGNDADDGSGVLLDMFISGTDFYDPASSGAKCPTTNHLKLSQDLRSAMSLGDDDDSGATYTVPCNIDAWINAPILIGIDNNDHLCYYAANGAYSTAGNLNADLESYRPIVYGDMFTRDFYNDAEIIANDLLVINGIDYDAGNVLTPGAELAITFKLGLPEPCVGDFSEGDIYFWGEAV